MVRAKEFQTTPTLHLSTEILEREQSWSWSDAKFCNSWSGPALFTYVLKWVPGLNPIALRKAKIVYNFGLSECNRVKRLINLHLRCYKTALLQSANTPCKHTAVKSFVATVTVIKSSYSVGTSNWLFLGLFFLQNHDAMLHFLEIQHYQRTQNTARGYMHFSTLTTVLYFIRLTLKHRV